MSIRWSNTVMALVALALLGFCVTFADYPIASFAHDVLRRPRFCVWLTWIADVPAPAATCGILVIGAAALLGWRPGRVGRLVLAACLATLAAVAAKDVLKYFFGRPWPETWVDHNPSWIGTHTRGFFLLHGGRGFASFPSGHTTAVTAPCAVAWRGSPMARPVAVLLPLLTMVGLIGADFHFLGDCIAGAMLGTGCGLLTVWLLETPSAYVRGTSQ